MRNPNGYGCIKHLSGRRRRPFVFVVTDAGRQRPVEYFTNLVDAQIFQADYHRAHHHRSLPGHKTTLAELYHRWLLCVRLCRCLVRLRYMGTLVEGGREVWSPN